MCVCVREQETQRRTATHPTPGTNKSASHRRSISQVTLFMKSARDRTCRVLSLKVSRVMPWCPSRFRCVTFLRCSPIDTTHPARLFAAAVGPHSGCAPGADPLLGDECFSSRLTDAKGVQGSGGGAGPGVLRQTRRGHSSRALPALCAHWDRPQGGARLADHP